MRGASWALWVLACTPTRSEAPPSVGAEARGAVVAATGVETKVAVVAEPVRQAEVDMSRVPELRQVWSAPKIQYGARVVDGGAGVVGRWSEFPETIVRVDARTGAELWRATQPNEVTWHQVRAGTTHAAIWGRLPGRGGDRVGWVDLKDGRLVWTQALAERAEPNIGLDGTGIGLYSPRECGLTVVDPADGKRGETLRGRTIEVGHSGPDGPQVDTMCATPPVLLGRTGACSAVLVPTGTAEMTIVGVGPQGRCWTVELGRVDDRVVFDPGTELLVWHAHATLHVGVIDRAAGRMRWRRQFVGEKCYPTAHVGPGGRMVVVNGCGQVVALGLDGKERWTTKATADAAVVEGEEDTTARLKDSLGVRWVQLLNVEGAATGRIEVPDRATAHAIGSGVLVDTRGSLVLRNFKDGSVVWERKVDRARWSAMGGYVFIKDGHPGGTLVVDARTGEALGHDPFGAEALAVISEKGKKIVVMRAGYVWARALP